MFAFVNLLFSEQGLAIYRLVVSECYDSPELGELVYKTGPKNILAQLVLQKQNQLDIAKAKFNQLLNRDLTIEVNLLEQFPELSLGTLSLLNQKALTQRPELKVLSEQVRASVIQRNSQFITPGKY